MHWLIYFFFKFISGKFTPEPGGRGPPGKDRKGATYDPAPSPTPRGIPAQQGSIRSRHITFIYSQSLQGLASGL